MSKVVIIGGGAAGMAAAIGAMRSADMMSPFMRKMRSLEKRSISREKDAAT